ncbi:hypothetical protein F2P81_018610 [Scophthalmus maximus]|uniref:Uncharacterized protein n=1 Tax=Scophthalmus maximus TaxID=52904 RepID=A0A6A4SAT8_SCOMX|nr:hypothetical protein F2P81_018610 [Scophthalmus maximus]
MVLVCAEIYHKDSCLLIWLTQMSEHEENGQKKNVLILQLREFTLKTYIDVLRFLRLISVVSRWLKLFYPSCKYNWTDLVSALNSPSEH